MADPKRETRVGRPPLLGSILGRLRSNFGLIVLVVAGAVALGIFEKRLYWGFLAFWLFFVWRQIHVRELYPKVPNLVVYLGWVILAVLGVVVGFIAYKTELSMP